MISLIILTLKTLIISRKRWVIKLLNSNLSKLTLN